MRILITGAAGIVGKALYVYLDNGGHDIIPVDITDSHDGVGLDLRHKAAVLGFIKQQAPELIIHLAATKHLGFCEQHKDIAHETNYTVTETLVQACLDCSIFMIFFSSDYVFGKTDQYWRETDIPCPTTQYGRDKTACEKLIQENLYNYAIVRTAQLYGFAGDFIHLVYTALTSGQTFTAFANLINNPTWIEDMIIMVDKIINYHHIGIFHCVGLQAMSRYQYACEIATALALDRSYIQAVELDFNQDIRPPVVRLDGTATYATLQYYPKTLRQNLRCLSFNQKKRK